MTLKKRTRWLLASLLFPAMFLGILFHTLWRKTEVVSLTDAGPTLVIDPGHGGIDCGGPASWFLRKNGNTERVERILSQITLNRLPAKTWYRLKVNDSSLELDSNARISEKKVSDLRHRTQIVNGIPGAVLVSIHQNTFPTGQASGPQVIYAPEENSRRLGTVTHANLLRSLYTESRRVAEPGTGKLYILSHLKCPAILVECGFLSNAADLANLKRPEFQVSLAAVLMASYLQYLVNTERI